METIRGDCNWKSKKKKHSSSNRHTTKSVKWCPGVWLIRHPGRAEKTWNNNANNVISHLNVYTASYEHPTAGQWSSNASQRRLIIQAARKFNRQASPWPPGHSNRRQQSSGTQTDPSYSYEPLRLRRVLTRWKSGTDLHLISIPVWCLQRGGMALKNNCLLGGGMWKRGTRERSGEVVGGGGCTLSKLTRMSLSILDIPLHVCVSLSKQSWDQLLASGCCTPTTVSLAQVCMAWLLLGGQTYIKVGRNVLFP